MDRVCTKEDLKNLEDRYEFLFPVPYETNSIGNRESADQE